jgi:type I restriction enzyme M protein
MLSKINDSLSKEILNKTLSELTAQVKNGLSSYYVNTGDVTVYLVNVKNVQNGRIDASNVETVKVRATEAIDRNRLEKGDLVVTAKGQNFKAAVAENNVEGYAISSNLIALKLNSQVDPELVAAYLNSPLGQREINARAAGGIVRGLNSKALLEIPVPIPPIEKQKVLVECLRIINEYSEILDKEQTLVDKIRNSVISDIMG